MTERCTVIVKFLLSTVGMQRSIRENVGNHVQHRSQFYGLGEWRDKSGAHIVLHYLALGHWRPGNRQRQRASNSQSK